MHGQTLVPVHFVAGNTCLQFRDCKNGHPRFRMTGVPLTDEHLQLLARCAKEEGLDISQAVQQNECGHRFLILHSQFGIYGSNTPRCTLALVFERYNRYLEATPRIERQPTVVQPRRWARLRQLIGV